jgi:site-specific DNA recombinase
VTHSRVTALASIEHCSVDAGVFISIYRQREIGLDAIGYFRVSTAKQAEEGLSLEAQAARIKAYCCAQGWTIRDDDFYSDEGKSGKSMRSRPGLRKALDRVCELKGALVVVSLSRLCRSTLDAITISERIAKAKGHLVSISEKIDTTSATGRAFFRIVAVFAELESEQVAERTKAIFDYKRALNQRMGQLAYGVGLAPDGVGLVELPSELETVKRIRQLRRDGWSLRKIARELTQRDVPTKRGSKRWAISTVRKIAAGVGA